LSMFILQKHRSPRTPADTAGTQDEADSVSPNDPVVNGQRGNG
jgi:hypothetical protein